MGEANANDQPKPSALDALDTPRVLAFGGLLFLMVALASLVAMFYLLTTAKVDTFDIKSDTDTRAIYAQLASHYLKPYLGPLMMFLVAILSSALGFAMIQISGRATRLVVNPNDHEAVFEMLKSKNHDGINDYIKLSSLTGIIGVFTKLGLSGLPLATIALTVTFAVLALITLGSGATSNAMLDLCKLTLGAFIGSYVQKQRTSNGSDNP